MNIPTWFTNAISRGLAELYALNLEGCPGADVLPGTGHVWAETLWSYMLPQQLTRDDESRLHAAFRALGRTCVRWPVPMLFLQHLPSRQPMKRIARHTAELTDTERERRRRIIERDREELGLKPLPPAASAKWTASEGL